MTGRRPVQGGPCPGEASESPAADLVTSQAEIPDYRDLNVFVLHIITVVSSDFTYLERESVTFERWMIRIIL